MASKGITIKNIQMGKGGLSADEVQDLREWTFEMDVDDEHLLTKYGYKNTKDLFYKVDIYL